MALIKTWLAAWGAVMSILIMCGLLDQPPAPTACVAELRDGVGNTVLVSGKVAEVSVN